MLGKKKVREEDVMEKMAHMIDSIMEDLREKNEIIRGMQIIVNNLTDRIDKLEKKG